jgi:hypothetical protein
MLGQAARLDGNSRRIETLELPWGEIRNKSFFPGSLGRRRHFLGILEIFHNQHLAPSLLRRMQELD